ncbi:heme o synthase [soil metagenome]
MERRSRSYLQLIKPGITLSNTLTGIAGFLLAASIIPFSLSAFIAATIGIATIIASACVVNNIIDRDIDKRMKRTAKRDVASGKISIGKAILFAILLGFIGFGAVFIWTNLLTFFLGVIAYVWYVVIYGVAKRTTVWSTLIGAVPGALPPVAGYTALTGTLDAATAILFLMMLLWQMAHFYAIAVFRKDDYASAKLPVWSVVYGLKSTKRQILIFAVAYGLSSLLLSVYGYAGTVYLTLSILIAVYWVYRGISLYNVLDDVKWSRKMFGASLLVMLSMCTLIAVGGYLP